MLAEVLRSIGVAVLALTVCKKAGISSEQGCTGPVRSVPDRVPFWMYPFLTGPSFRPFCAIRSGRSARLQSHLALGPQEIRSFPLRRDFDMGGDWKHSWRSSLVRSRPD